MIPVTGIFQTFYHPETSHTASTRTRWHSLADISRSTLCCHINETRVPIANTLNIAQPRGHAFIPFPQLASGSVQ